LSLSPSIKYKTTPINLLIGVVTFSAWQFIGNTELQKTLIRILRLITTLGVAFLVCLKRRGLLLAVASYLATVGGFLLGGQDHPIFYQGVGLPGISYPIWAAALGKLLTSTLP